MTLWPTFLAGTNFVMHSAGWLESGLVSCYEKFIVDVELLRMLHHVFQPLKINEETLAFSAHQEVGAGRSLPRRRAHARALPRVLLPAAALVDGELRALEPPRRAATRRARERRSARRRSRSTSSREWIGAEGRAEGVRRPATTELGDCGDSRCSSTAHGRPRRRARRSPPCSPATGEAIGEVPQGTREDAQRAIDAANRASDALGAADGVRARGARCTASPTRSRSAATSLRTR